MGLLVVEVLGLDRWVWKCHTLCGGRSVGLLMKLIHDLHWDRLLFAGPPEVLIGARSI